MTHRTSRKPRTVNEEAGSKDIQQDLEPIQALGRLVFQRSSDCLTINNQEETPHRDREHLRENPRSIARINGFLLRLTFWYLGTASRCGFR
jgi:hypothetical protein